MTAQILDGKQLAGIILRKLKEKIESLPADAAKPKLAIVQVLGDEASSIYVTHKLRTANEIGMLAEHITFPSDVPSETLTHCLESLSHDRSFHGILLQLPLPTPLLASHLLTQIDPQKDVDGLTPFNLGCVLQKQPRMIPCTPKGILALLKHYHIAFAGKEVVILNASALVGRPLAMLLLSEGATVTVCNSKTQPLEAYVQRAEILISATGKPQVIPTKWLKPGVVVVDVGVHRTSQGIVGDIDFSAAQKIASAITPVPGGVGPMTVAMLMENLLTAYQIQVQ